MPLADDGPAVSVAAPGAGRHRHAGPLRAAPGPDPAARVGRRGRRRWSPSSRSAARRSTTPPPRWRPTGPGRAERGGDRVRRARRSGSTTVAGAVAFEISASVMIVAALMAMFTVGRHTRADEEAGRTELVRAARVGRHAPLLAAVARVGAGLRRDGAGDRRGRHGHRAAAAGFVPAGRGGGRLRPGLHRRRRGGRAGERVHAVGLRAGGRRPRRRLPAARRRRHRGQRARLGLADRLGAGGAPVLRQPVVAAAALRGRDRALLAVAVVLLDHRDLGAGLLPARPGAAGGRAPARHAAGPGGPAAAGGAARLGGQPGAARRGLRRPGRHGARPCSRTIPRRRPSSRAPRAPAWWTPIWPPSSPSRRCSPRPTRSSSVLRARSEEAAGRAEPVLATATSRTAWLGSHVTVALLGSAAAGRRVRRGDRAGPGDVDRRRRLVRPAVRRVARLRAGRVGRRRASPWRPSAPPPGGSRGGVGRWWPTSWWSPCSPPALNWPDWVGDLSPFAWTPLVPIESWTAAAAVGLVVVAAGLLAVGFGAFRRRDLISVETAGWSAVLGRRLPGVQRLPGPRPGRRRRRRRRRPPGPAPVVGPLAAVARRRGRAGRRGAARRCAGRAVDDAVGDASACSTIARIWS